MTTGSVREPISPREREVLAALATHATNAEIAERLFLSVRTVESHVASLLRKTGARDRRALAALDLEREDAAPPARPSTLTSFVGRVAERSALAAALAEHRLVTALGPGGVGKTRLAFAVAADVVDRYPDGVWLVDLVPVTDPDRIALAVAERIGVQERQGHGPVEALEAWLSARRTLLVLDNCEHLLDPVAALLERLLAGCPGLTVLATSRTRLAVPFEWVLPVPGLSGGAAGDAWALFTARARAAGAPTSDADHARIEVICTALEGMALAIELAAARLPSLGLDGLEAELGHRLELLTGGGRAEARHRSLRAALDWSHDLLTPAERVVLRRVSVFATPFPATAAVDVVTALPGLPRTAVRSALAALVDCSLLDAVRSTDGTSYRALETIRQYGAELLDAEQETATIRGAHLLWCLRRAERLPVEPQLGEGWIGDVDALADEARSALDRDGIGTDDLDSAFRLAERLARLMFARGVPAEAQRRFEQAAAFARDPAARGYALAAAAGAAEARQFGTSALALRRRAADAFEEAGLPAAAAAELTRSAVTIDRFASMIDPPVDPQVGPALRVEARSLAGNDPVVRARIAVAELFALDDSEVGTEAVVVRVLEESLRAGDPLARSEALDADCAGRLIRGDLRGAYADVLERVDLLASSGARPELGLEPADVLTMASSCATAVGDLPGAERFARLLRDLPQYARETHIAVSAQMTVAFLVGDLHRCERLGLRLVDGWERAGRPRIGAISPSAYAAGCAAALRGEPGRAAEWFDMAQRALAPPLMLELLEGLGFRLVPLLHFGEVREAFQLETGNSLPWLLWYDASWRPWYTALHAEAAVLSRVADAATAVEDARHVAAQNPVAAALVDRAEALRVENPSALPPLADRLDALDARYQAARTRVMAGGSLRERGESELAACGAAPMAWPLP